MQTDIFDVNNKRIAITGGGGVLCGTMASALASRGAEVVVLDYNAEAAKKVCDEIAASGGKATPVECNVLEKDAVRESLSKSVEILGGVDVLINGAGGNNKGATCTPPETYFGLDEKDISRVFELNCMGTIIPSQVFGEHMADRGDGVIINISSMGGKSPSML